MNFMNTKEIKKSEILSLQLQLEAIFTNIQTRLTQMKRPPFQPFEGLTLADKNDTVKELEKTELERNKKLHAQTARFTRQTNRWLTMYQGLNDAIKELGDVSNWAQSMETEMEDLAVMLDSVIQIKKRELEQQSGKHTDKSKEKEKEKEKEKDTDKDKDKEKEKDKGKDEDTKDKAKDKAKEKSKEKPKDKAKDKEKKQK